MITIILPGFSQKNELWAESVKKDLHSLGDVTAVRWPHWDNQERQENWKETEADKIAQKVDDNEIILIAKSIGTLVAMEILRKGVKVKKLILCGIPLNDIAEEDTTPFAALKNIDPNNVVIFQNDEDPHGKPEQVKELFDKLNLNLKIEIKKRNDHEYFYSENFLDFIENFKD